jgi:hypothetical protein
MNVCVCASAVCMLVACQIEGSDSDWCPCGAGKKKQSNKVINKRSHRRIVVVVVVEVVVVVVVVVVVCWWLCCIQASTPCLASQERS